MQVFYLLVLLVCSSSLLSAQAAGQYRTPAGELPYRLISPTNMEAGKKYPLIVFFHGAGERGTDNQAQLTHIDKAFERIQAEQPCFILLPQCPKEARWVEVDWSAKGHRMPERPSPWLQGSMDVVDSLLQVLPLEEKRLYAMGLSMGGFATWEAIARWPERFAAAVPICGGGDPAQAAAMAELPIWAFHGLKDRVVLPSRTTEMLKALRGQGNKAARQSLYPEVGHGAWTPALQEADLFPWLFQQTRP